MAALMRCRLGITVSRPFTVFLGQQQQYCVRATPATQYVTNTTASERSLTIKEEDESDFSQFDDHVQNDTIQYPKVKPEFPPGHWGDMPSKLAWLWHDSAETVAEHKNLKQKTKFLTEKVYKTWKFPVINLAPKSLQYQCCVTKTHISRNLPDLYSTIDVDTDLSFVKDAVIESLEMEHHMSRSRFKKQLRNRITFHRSTTLSEVPYRSSRLKVDTLLTELLGLLGKHSHVDKCLVDKDVSVAACFNRYGVLRAKRFSLASPRKGYVRQNNAPFQGEHIVDVQIRKTKPLPQFAPFRECNLEEGILEAENPIQPDFLQVPSEPKFLGQFAEHLERKITSGFNLVVPDVPPDPHSFTHLSVVYSNHGKIHFMANKFGEDCGEQAIVGYGLTTSFLSAVAQAHMQGFNEHQDLTYPITTQTILTDGRNFRMSAYQLNTLELWKDNDANPNFNNYWIDETTPLFQGFENGKIVGFNEDVLRTILKFILIKPTTRDIDNLQPYLESPDLPQPSVLIPTKEEFTTVETPLIYDR